MARKGMIGLALVLVVVAAVVLIARDHQKPADDYDYAAAFEASAPGSTAPILKITDVVGKTADELRAVLGPPENCETSLYSSRCTYAPGQTEVVFIDGKADWITINALGETVFDAAALARIGLSETKPTERSETELLWTSLPGLRELRVVGDGARIDFIRIKARS